MRWFNNKNVFDIKQDLTGLYKSLLKATIMLGFYNVTYAYKNIIQLDKTVFSVSVSARNG